MLARILSASLVTLTLISTAAPSTAHAHDGHHAHAYHSHGRGPAPATYPTIEAPARQDGTTGEGRFRFRRHAIELPEAMRTHLKKAHGGFAVDRESEGGDGSTYFGLSGVGLLRLLPDLSAVEVIGGDPKLAAVNLHNAAIVQHGKERYLALPSDQGQRVFITTLRGEIVRELPNPYGEKPAFRVCDVEVVGSRLFAVNGYADNVCFVADLKDDFKDAIWTGLRFGGRGKEHGKFGTAHGVTRVPGTNVITVADRANARLETYTDEGRFIGTLPFEPGTMPCDVDYLDDLTVVGCLKGPGGAKPAPVYLLEKGNRVAELNPGRDLGLATFQHVHNAAFRKVGDRLFVLVYAWNPGDLVILEHTPETGN